MTQLIDAMLLTDLLSLAIGPLLGVGGDRIVTESLLAPESVMKFAKHKAGVEANQTEWIFWQSVKDDSNAARWCAPCLAISHGGMILMQRRTTPIPVQEGVGLRVPVLFGDTRVDNWGFLDGRHVCHDYASIRHLPGSDLYEEHLYRQERNLSACQPTAIKLTPNGHAELDESVPEGVAGLVGRLRSRSHTLDDMKSLLRVLLEGAGAPKAEATQLVGLPQDVRTQYDIVATMLAASLVAASAACRPTTSSRPLAAP